jgi:hypothetical protein
MVMAHNYVIPFPDKFSYSSAMCLVELEANALYVRFEVSTAVTMKNGVFWDVTPCGSCKNRRFGGTAPPS